MNKYKYSFIDYGKELEVAALETEVELPYVIKGHEIILEGSSDGHKLYEIEQVRLVPRYSGSNTIDLSIDIIVYCKPSTERYHV